MFFMFPIMRQIMTWVGTFPAKRKNISAIFNRHDGHCAIFAGGIAEMYLMNDSTEDIYLKKRRNTIKVAIYTTHIL